MDIVLTGLDRVVNNLDRLAQLFPRAAAQALNAVAETTMTDAKERTPVRYGILRASGKVSRMATAGKLEADLTFGTEYAIFVHERTELRHKTGEAKFLERALLKTAGTFPEDIADGIRAHLVG